jgi:hypothetical protein
MFMLPRRQAPADPSWDIESPRFDRSVLSGRSLKQIEGDSLKKIPRRARASILNPAARCTVTPWAALTTIMAAHPPMATTKKGPTVRVIQRAAATPSFASNGMLRPSGGVPCSGQFASDIINTPESSASSVAVWWAITGQVQPHSIASVVPGSGSIEGISKSAGGLAWVSPAATAATAAAWNRNRRSELNLHPKGEASRIGCSDTWSNADGALLLTIR